MRYAFHGDLLTPDGKKSAFGQPEAVAALERLADKYKGENGSEALFLAAEIVRKDIKDAAGETKLYDRIAAEYEKSKEAPKALYAAGEAWEKARDYGRAREYYTRITEKYPDDNFSKKARKRLDSLLEKKG